MYIESISFERKYFEKNKWEIDNFYLSKINLIAGKNASGKTRILNSISTLIDFLREGNIDSDSLYYSWNIKLIKNKIEYIYDLKIDNSIVLFEELKIDNDIYFSRDKEGKGKIIYESKKDLELDFAIENSKILLANKRDKIQHLLLEPIFNWINSFYLFEFGDSLGQGHRYDIRNNIPNNDKQVVYKFKKGLDKFGDKFKNRIIETFNGIGYGIEDIYIKDIVYQVYALYIKENSEEISQREISQGMFRVLSLVVQITYLEFSSKKNITILIDDIGEGLDFERANNLIKYLVKNAKMQRNKLQLIMTTNDRLVMNNVPLEHWIIVDKDDNGKINFYSEKTHSKIFKKFKRIGLNNFDFFSSEYYKEN